VGFGRPKASELSGQVGLTIGSTPSNLILIASVENTRRKWLLRPIGIHIFPSSRKTFRGPGPIIAGIPLWGSRLVGLGRALSTLLLALPDLPHGPHGQLARYGSIFRSIPPVCAV
jgi:hypothetical protein